MRTSITKNKSPKKLFRWLAAALFWAAVWQIAAVVVNKEVLVASPAEVFRRLYIMMGKLPFWHTTGASLLRILIGFSIAVVSGAVLAVISHFSGLLNTLFSPLISIIRATPVASFIILALVWIKTGSVPSFIAFLMVLPIVWGNISQGLKQTDVKLLEMARVYRLSARVRIKKIYMPSVMPYFAAACKTSLGLAWKAGVAAEVLCTPAHSIGKQLYESKIYLETPDVFAWTLVVIALSYIIEKLMVYGIDKIIAAPLSNRRAI